MTDNAALFTTRADRYGTLLDGAEGHWGERSDGKMRGGERTDGKTCWDAPTPCTGWTVRDVVRHTIDTEREFLDRHDLHLAVVVDADTDPAAAWRAHAAAVGSVLADGAADRAIDGYFGPTTIGATMADFYGWDLMIHGWDIARATGQEWPVTADEAEALGRTADGWGPALYSEGVCAPAVQVPADASPQDRLLARLGRDPHWRP